MGSKFEKFHFNFTKASFSFDLLYPRSWKLDKPNFWSSNGVQRADIAISGKEDSMIQVYFMPLHNDEFAVARKNKNFFTTKNGFDAFPRYDQSSVPKLPGTSHTGQNARVFGQDFFEDDLENVDHISFVKSGQVVGINLIRIPSEYHDDIWQEIIKTLKF